MMKLNKINRKYKEKENPSRGLTDKDELVLSQMKPYLSGSILCSILAVLCLLFIGFKPDEMAFWLCIITLFINLIFFIAIYLRGKKIRGQ